MASRNIVKKKKHKQKKTRHVVLNQLCSSLWTSRSCLYILADLISFLEIQRLQLAGSSSTVFAVNLIPSRGVVLKETASRPGVPYTLFQRNPIDGSLGITKRQISTLQFCRKNSVYGIPASPPPPPPHLPPKPNYF